MTATVTALKTRKPTGRVAFPLILLEGDHKTGKSYEALALSASEKIGRTFVCELGEPTADEYASLGPFEILEHDGRHASMYAQLKAATQVLMANDKPNLIVVDGGSAWWDLLKRWLDHRARRSDRGRRTLAADPDAEVDISMTLWNDAKDRWNSVVNLLRAWEGIAIITARGRDVTKVQGGQPVAGQTEWSVEVEKGTPFAVSAVVRMHRPHTAKLMSAWSLHADIPAGGLALPADNPLEHVVFGILGAGGTFQKSSAVLGDVDEDLPYLVDRAVALFGRGDADGLRDLWREANGKGLIGEGIMPPDRGTGTTLGQYIRECAEEIGKRNAGAELDRDAAGYGIEEVAGKSA